MSELVGIIACGGKSSRMGFDKSLAIYHQLPQRYHLYGLLKKYISEVFISCNAGQQLEIPSEYKTIVDNPRYLNAGPMTALLSAIDSNPEKNILLIGCDYPDLKSEHIIALTDSFWQLKTSVCLSDVYGLTIEPLLAIYSCTSFGFIREQYLKGNRSLKACLETEGVFKIKMKSLRNVNNERDFVNYEYQG